VKQLYSYVHNYQHKTARRVAAPPGGHPAKARVPPKAGSAKAGGFRRDEFDEDVFFPSLDGVPLEAWFIPADSDKLLIINHPMTCNRYGFPGHLPPWNTMVGGFEVNFLPELKHLHDAATISSRMTSATAA
jgi:hypothetical protein